MTSGDTSAPAQGGPAGKTGPLPFDTDRAHEAGATDYVEADLRDTDTILGHAGRVLDLGKPVAVTLVAILHAIPDADDPHAIVAKLMDAVPSGSYLVVTHMAWDILDDRTQ